MISPPLERVVREEPIVVAALALEAAAAFLAGLFFNLGAAAALAAAALLNDPAWTVEKLQELVPTFRQQQRKAGRRSRAGSERARSAPIGPKGQ
jgi:hypothetical protein